jgi:uncharacterized protein YebE (UPF0316 family)
MSDVWGKIRTIGLIVMIGCALVCEAILIMNHMWHWAIYWGTGVIIGVIVTEIIAYAQTSKTISTQWRDWAKTKPLAAYGALGAMAMAFLGLIVHLAFWGGMFKKEDK